MRQLRPPQPCFCAEVVKTHLRLQPRKHVPSTSDESLPTVDISALRAFRRRPLRPASRVCFGRNASSQGVLNGMVRDANSPYHGDACCDSRSEFGRDVSARWLTRIRLRIPSRVMRSRTRTALRRLRYHRGNDNDLHDTSHLSSGQNGSHAVKVPRVRLSNRHASSRTSADKRSVP